MSSAKRQIPFVVDQRPLRVSARAREVLDVQALGAAGYLGVVAVFAIPRLHAVSGGIWRCSSNV